MVGWFPQTSSAPPVSSADVHLLGRGGRERRCGHRRGAERGRAGRAGLRA